MFLIQIPIYSYNMLDVGIFSGVFNWNILGGISECCFKNSIISHDFNFRNFIALSANNFVSNGNLSWMLLRFKFHNFTAEFYWIPWSNFHSLVIQQNSFIICCFITCVSDFTILDCSERHRVTLSHTAPHQMRRGDFRFSNRVPYSH